MLESPPELGQPRFTVDSTAGTHLAWFRTRLMLERTMVSWLMTSITLIGSGFAIVLIFDQFNRLTRVAPALRPLAPFHFGLVLIGAGIAGLVVAGWQYRTVLRYLRSGDLAAVTGGGKQPAQSVAYAVTIVTIFIGVFTFLAVAARML